MSNYRYLISTIVILFCFIGQSTFAGEENLYEIPLKQKIDSSLLIVSGKVVKSEPYWDMPGGLIYTNHTIQLNVIYKGSISGQTISVRTVGGRIGNEMHTTSSLLTLEPGDVGIFFCNPIEHSDTYDIYASKQGFLAFIGGKAICPFYSSGIKELETEIFSVTQSYQSVQSSGWDLSPVTPLLAESVSLSPTIITAGTNSQLTVTGTGFGTTGPDSVNFVAFSNADNGGTGFVIPDTSTYTLWTDTMIILYVPTKAGTGPLKISIAGMEQITNNVLTVPFAILNTNDFSIPRLVDLNGSGGMLWSFNSNMNTSGAALAFNRAKDTWRCATGVNWSISPTTTIVANPASGDGINVVALNVVPAGVLGVCYNYFISCNSTDWHVTGQDIIFKTFSIGEGYWNYSTSAPSIIEYDFESVALHELGHAHLLGHVIDGNDVLNYSISNSQMRRTLSSGNLGAGTYVMNISTTSYACGTSPMIQSFPAGCSQTSLTDVWLSESSLSLNNSSCFGLNDIRLSFANYGQDSITAIEFGWSLNGQEQSPVSWAGSLGFNEIYENMLVSSYNFQDSLYEIVIWVNTVNGIQELNQSNDTLIINFHPVPCTPNNAAVEGIGNIDMNSCLSTQPITVDLINAGTNNLTSCKLITEANGIPIDTLFWTGNLLPGDTIPDLAVTTFGDFYPTVIIKIRAFMPNGVPDTYSSNDTTSILFFPNKLSGMYTVGGSSPDFNTLNEVFTRLDNYGVCGDVTINIRPGTYPVDVYIDSIPADNLLYGIVFQSESGNASDVNITKLSPAANFILNRAHNLTFHKLSFYDTTEWYLKGQYGTKNLTWEYNKFTNATVWIDGNQNDKTCDNIRIHGNTFSGGSIVAYDDPFYQTTASNIKITNNSIEEPGGRIEVTHYKNILIDHNQIWQSHYGLYYQNGITVRYESDSLTISNNTVRKYSDGGSTVRVWCFTSPAETSVRIFNNQLIQQPEESSSQIVAVDLYGMPHLEFHHNSVLFHYPYVLPGYSSVIYLSSIDSAVIYNNQFIHSGPRPIFRLQNMNAMYSDYNNYYTTGNFSYNVNNSGTLPDLSAFAANYNSDAHSTFFDPQFADVDYLMPTNILELDNLGTPVGYIGTDLNGINRNTTTPDIGAFEFHPLQYDLKLADTSNLEDTTFCQGSSTNLILRAFNNGTETIYNFLAYVSLNGVPVDTVLINETILPQQSVSFTVGNYDFMNPQTEVTVVCTQPNGQTDLMPYNNDYSYTFRAKLNGTYTVGQAPSDFSTIQEALQSLSLGICGPVVFNLKEGYHDNWGRIDSIPNNNSINTITFQSFSGDTSSAIISANLQTKILQIDGPQYVTFRNLKFATHGSFDYSEIKIVTANKVTIENCRFEDAKIYNVTAGPLTGLTVTNNHFISSYLDLQGRATDISISNNLFEGTSTIMFTGWGWEYVPHDFRIFGNRFNNVFGIVYNDAAIRIDNCRQFDIYQNVIHSSCRAFTINNCGHHSFIKNNFVRSNTHILSYFYGNSDLHIVHNSFYNTGFFFTGDNPYIEFKNNIVSNPGTSPTFHFTDQNQLSQPISDYNLFYGNTNNFASYISGTPLTFIVWRNTYGDDTHSVVGDPQFVSPTDLHTSSPLASNNGIFLPYAFDDIDGESRNTTSPDIGADEFGFDSLLLFDIALDSILTPQNSLCNPDYTLVVRLTNHSNTNLTSAHFLWTTGITAGFYSELNWTGSIAPGASQTITLGDLILMDAFPDNIYVTVTTPNGGTDTNTVDNYLTMSYTYYTGVNIATDQPFICTGGTTELYSSIGEGDLLWSTGSTALSTTLSTPGTYWLQVTTSYGCVFTDTIEIMGYPTPTPVMISVWDSTICEGELAWLTANPIIIGNTYLWSTNDTNSTIPVGFSGTYVLTTTDSNGCVTTDQQQIINLGNTYSSFILTNNFVLVSDGFGETSYQWLLNGSPIPGATSSTYSVLEDGVYSLQTTNSNGCSNVSDVMYVNYSGVGLNEPLISDITISPNPASDYFSISFTGVSSVDFVLLDMSGRTVMELNDVVSNQLISLSTLQAGMYAIVPANGSHASLLLVKL